MVCSKWAERLPSRVMTVQPSSRSAGLAPADVHHRLDREHVPDLQLHAPARGPVVGHLRVFVHRGADPVAHVLAHHAEPGRLGDALDRGADVAEAVAFDDLVDRGLERPPRDLEQPRRLGVDLTHAHGDRGVGVPALDDRPAVDGDDVALVEHDGVARDAVHDHVVRRRAHHRGEPVVPEEVRARAAPFDHVTRGTVEIGGGGAGHRPRARTRRASPRPLSPPRRMSAICSRDLRAITATRKRSARRSR